MQNQGMYGNYDNRGGGSDRKGSLREQLKRRNMQKMIELSQESTVAETPGPGAYEVNTSGCISSEFVRKLRNDRSLEKIHSLK